MGSLFHYVKLRFEALFQEDEANVAWQRRWLLRCGKFLYIFARKFHQDLALERAASLAFAATISLIPLGIILFMLFHNFGDFEDRVRRMASWFVTQFVADQPSADVPDQPAEPNDARDEVREWMDAFLDNLKKPLENTGAVTPLALLGLIIAASSLFRTAERNFSAVWDAETKRGLFQRFANFWMMLTVIPILLGLSLFPDFTAASRSGVVVTFLKNDALPVCIAFFGFVVLISQLPNARVRLNAAGFGALLAAIVWVLGTRVFIYYVQNWAAQSVYGALGVLPFFLVWVYFSWLVAIGGCEVSYCLQHFTVLEREVRYHVSRLRVSRPVHALLIMERIYQGFAGTRSSPTSEDLAVELQAPLTEIEELLDVMRDADLLVEDDSGHVLPKLDASELRPARVIEVFPMGSGYKLPVGLSASSSSGTRLIRELSDDVERKLSASTFAEMLKSTEG